MQWHRPEPLYIHRHNADNPWTRRGRDSCVSKWLGRTQAECITSHMKKKEIQDTKDHLLGPGGWKSYSVDWLLRSALKVKRIRIIKLWKLICKMSSCNTTFKACRHLTHSCDEMKKQLTFALLPNTFPYSTLPFITKTYSDSGFCLSSYHTITRYYTALWTNILESKISHFWEQR